MQGDIGTRAIRAEDYEAVIELWLQAEGVEVAEGDDPETILNYLKRNPGLSRVAVCEGRIVGGVLCGHDGRRGFLYHLAVVATQRGRGIGQRLVQEALDGLRLCGIKRALILVERDNIRGSEFWRARGFEEITGARPFGIDLL